jgi:hypothetical protein
VAAQEFERLLSAEEKVLLTSLGGLDQLLATLNQRLSEQKGATPAATRSAPGAAARSVTAAITRKGSAWGERASMARRQGVGGAPLSQLQ